MTFFSPHEFVAGVEEVWQKFFAWLNDHGCLCQPHHHADHHDDEDQRDLLFQLMNIPKDCDMCMTDQNVEPAASFDSDEDALFLSDIIQSTNSLIIPDRSPLHNNTRGV